MRQFLFALLLLLIPALARSQDGIYADFQTSLGNFTCQLHFDRAPRTVANFVALVTGNRAWLDLRTGDAKRRPFYDGLTFHRVVSGFVIQGGSPNGNGTDGPGYTFRDEFHPTLRHNSAGVLSMANSGSHSNGSQFFVTLGATSHLDDVHSVFGNVTSGLNVVQAIGNVPVNSSSRPLTPVIMQSVTIRRVGAAAEAFNIDAQGLPSVGGAKPTLVTPSPGALQLQFPRALYSEYFVYDSADLVTWTDTRVGLYVTTPPAGNWDVSASAGKTRHFYRVPEVAYPGPLYTPPSLGGRTLTMNLGGGTFVTLVFGAVSGGTSNLITTSSNTNGVITNTTWSQEAYRGQLIAETSNIIPLVVSLVFNDAGSGTLKGTAYPDPPANPFSVSGTFTLTGP